MEIYKRIRTALQYRNMSQSKLADITGFSEVHISNITRGVKGKNMNIETLRTFAKALNVSMAYLLGETDILNKEPNTVPHQKLNDKPLGQLLKDLLDAKNLRPADLANMDIGVKTVQIGNYIRGSRTPQVGVLSKIAETLNVPVGYFFNEVPLDEALGQNEDKEKKPAISKLLGIINELDVGAINEVIRQAEKEKSLQDYQKLILPTKKLS